MGATSSRTSVGFDAAAGVTLRASGSAAVTSTATDTAISLSELKTAYWANNEIPHGKFVVAIDVVSLNVDTSQTYTFDLMVDDSATLADAPVSIDKFAVTLPGVYERVIDSAAIPLLHPAHSGADMWMATRVTIAGSGTKSIVYAAWIAKSLGA